MLTVHGVAERIGRSESRMRKLSCTDATFPQPVKYGRRGLAFFTVEGVDSGGASASPVVCAGSGDDLM
jgi:hypothetical protein